MKYFSLVILLALLCISCAKPSDPPPTEKPSILSITPSSGPPGTRVVIKGAHFAATSLNNLVRFNHDSATVVSASVDSLVAIAPGQGSTGPVSVTTTAGTADGPVFTYTDSVDVYVAGPALGVMYWKNGQQIFLESTQGNFGGAYGIAVVDTDIYVGSFTYFTYPSPYYYAAAYWKNGKKILLTTPDHAAQVRALVVAGKDIYCGGSENDIPVYWKNGLVYPLPRTGSGYGRVNAMAMSGNDVYAAGVESGNINDYIDVYWKNGVEKILSTSGPVDLGATSIAVEGNDVYVCGIDSGNAVYWKNGNKVVLDRFVLGGAPLGANAIAINNNSLYVAGGFRGDAVYWKDGNRVTLPSRSPSGAEAIAIAFYKSDIYVAGRDGSGVVYWKNGVEVDLCCSLLGEARAITVVKSQL